MEIKLFKKERKPLIRISRKANLETRKKILIKISSIIFALILCALISNIIAEGSFFTFLQNVFVNNFASTKRGVTSFSLQKTINLLWSTSILLIITLSVTPAFKMKFWNIGGEGQILMGAFGSLIVMKFMAPTINNNFAVLTLMLLFGMIFAAIWSVIPAIFKCLFNTNETLFTLMMNYIAMAIVGFFSYEWRATGKTAIGIVNEDTHLGWIPKVTMFDGKSYDYVIGIIIVIIVALILTLYLKYFKQGYEINVLGGSRNTARYIGISINKVTIRTMMIVGALSGICGWLLVAAGSHTINQTLVNGQGFTGVLISWLGHFNTGEIAIYSFLVAFITKGSENAASALNYSSSVSSILIGVFFFALIASEFFINFKVSLNLNFRNGGDLDGHN